MRVLIVGAGPSGLMMALCLKEYGVHATIIDKKSSITMDSKAIGMQARTLEVFKDLGLAHDFVESGTLMSKMYFYKGSKLLGLASFSWLDTAFAFILGISQATTESKLEQALAAKGVHVKWNTTLEQLQEMEDKVFVTLNKDGAISSELFDYVIGCDGIHSKVREEIGISFKGMKEPENFAIADVEMAQELNKKGILAFIAEDDSGLVLLFPLQAHRTRIVINRCLLPQGEKPSLSYLQDIIEQRTQLKVHLKNLYWSSVFNIQYKKASQFSKGNCFLVGDAAHVHSPVGAQGMNTGLQDAYNLAWKLAMVMKKQASSQLLQTYHEERHQNAVELLRMTKMMSHLTLARSKIICKLRPLILKMLLQKRSFNRWITRKISQLGNHYRKSSLSRASGGFSFGSKSKKIALQAGDRLLDSTINPNQKASSLLDWVQGPHFSILIYTTHIKSSEKQIRQLDFLLNAKYPEIALFVITMQNEPCELADFSGKIATCASAVFEKYCQGLYTLYVLRPDKYVGYIQQRYHQKSLENYLDGILNT